MSKSMSLDDLVALNDEIAGLVRSGLPLELGLAGWGRDLPGALGSLASTLGQQTAAGRSLAESMADMGDQIPPVYRALVTAGLRSGRLSSALESMSHTARNLREIRGTVALAVLYPLLLILLSYCLFMMLAAPLMHLLMAVYEAEPPKFWSYIAEAGSLSTRVIPLPAFAGFGMPVVLIPPLVLVGAAVVWWLGTKRAMMVDAGSAARWLTWVPVAGRAVRESRSATLAEVLGLLVQHDVPMNEALVLAADCTADRRLMKAARRASSAIERGAAPAEFRGQLTDLPPLLAWLIISGARQQTFTAMAAHIADTYRRRIARDSQWLRETLPILLVMGVGAVVVLAYALAIYLPFIELMDRLATPGTFLRAGR
ncbi:MAG TPA: type II secretion system F family protein [Pirellulales bacterium]|nr:type II secretion system F family protein [Pirellulales bacterium]